MSWSKCCQTCSAVNVVSWVAVRPPEALSAGETDVTLCPPGGVALAAKLAEKLHVEIDLSKLDHEPLVAFVHEERCIGCTKCILVCPTDCIIGAPKKLHTVIQSACVGGAACLEVWSN